MNYDRTSIIMTLLLVALFAVCCLHCFAGLRCCCFCAVCFVFFAFTLFAVPSIADADADAVAAATIFDTILYKFNAQQMAAIVKANQAMINN